MFSIVNSGVQRCCTTGTVHDKSVYLQQHALKIDLVIGVLLCLIGTLAGYGVIPIAGSGLMVGLGIVQIILTLILQCTPCGKWCYRKMQTACAQRR
jgi:hypothetical protein